MIFGFYPKLTLDSMLKNKRRYLSYIFRVAVMVMMYYILSCLTESPALFHMRGTSALMSILDLGCVVIIGVFAFALVLYQFLPDASKIPRIWALEYARHE